MEHACSHDSNYLRCIGAHSGLQDGAVSLRWNNRSQAPLTLLLLTEHSVPGGSLHRFPREGGSPRSLLLGELALGWTCLPLTQVPVYWSFKDPWVCLKPQGMQISLNVPICIYLGDSKHSLAFQRNPVSFFFPQYKHNWPGGQSI